MKVIHSRNIKLGWNKLIQGEKHYDSNKSWWKESSYVTPGGIVLIYQTYDASPKESEENIIESTEFTVVVNGRLFEKTVDVLLYGHKLKLMATKFLKECQRQT